ncbi:alcohol dehydrogenase catalytic domain-containing protein [Pedobacter sp. HMF7647]|uniref:Alcohol dehydrogenase catalytic domain-containing protein n=1 Tax=Hufsiella arboris TaxID=2695275 RepID=A0A7K1Y4L0_9SPHI|nr:zinc-binding alcohol dehydrogenase family protein [Hufsiella arboris]MXV49516.1 alcohol dehydrogenase catalytic domain-containing protein [Hufsiella arboris]
MKTLSCTTPGTLDYIGRKQPDLKKDHTILKIKRVGICGTDLHAFEGKQPFFEYPRVLGHELAGEIVEMDNAPGFELGETVTIIPYFSCGNCISCRNGKPNCCVRIKVCGVHTDGGMAEYLSVPSNSLVHSQGLSLDELALVEPLAIGAHGISRTNLKPGEFILVVGAGPIGLGAMEFAKITGANVIALDVNESRLQFCKTTLGIDYTIDAKSADISGQLANITNGDMPTVIIDATGSQAAINNSFQYMAHGARYLLIGLQKGDISFSHPEFHKREGTLMSSRNALRSDFDHVIASMKNNLVKPSTYITHKVSFDKAKDSFKGFLAPENNVIKAMISFD